MAKGCPYCHNPYSDGYCDNRCRFMATRHTPPAPKLPAGTKVIVIGRDRDCFSPKSVAMLMSALAPACMPVVKERGNFGPPRCGHKSRRNR